MHLYLMQKKFCRQCISTTFRKYDEIFHVWKRLRVDPFKMTTTRVGPTKENILNDF